MTNKPVLITGGTIVDPARDLHEPGDVLIVDGVIAAADTKIERKDVERIDAAGMLVLPGLIDMHVHLREPGFEESETIVSGCEAAVRGGFTSVCAMPNTNPPTDEAGRVRYILEQAEQAKARVYPVGAITRERKGAALVEMHDMTRAGAVAFSDDGISVADTAVMLNALVYAAMVGRPVIGHEEDPHLHRGGQMNDGALAGELGLKGIPAVAEEVMIARDIALAGYAGVPLHVTHISTKGSVDIIRGAKRRGVKVTCDVTPHHLALTEERVASFDTRYKMNPPLRTPEDVAAIHAGLADGTIDAIATDHAPHALAYKECEFIDAAFGTTGLETALGVVQKVLVDSGALTWKEVVRLLSLTPAAILGVPGGTLQDGAIGDVTVYDPSSTWRVVPDRMFSQSSNTAFFDWEMPGTVKATVVGGQVYTFE